ncbi:MAG: DUF4870 domain-containing protein [Aquaticitalea sp.]
MDTQTIEEGKTLAIVSYFTFVGLIIAIIMNIEKKNPFTAFHIRQMLGLIIMLIFSNLAEKYVNSWLGTAFWTVTFVSWIYCLYYVLKGQTETVPVLGPIFQDWFKNIN